MNQKKLYKSTSDKKIDGVCAGLAEYFNQDPTLIRAIYAGLTVFSAFIPGVVAYFVFSWIMPTKEEVNNG